ncbi:MAG: hypothetical protein CR993_04625 [Rhodobacterales bacterium]|nr:MAG: hypothetical protein CR993_04625 [Rhodobacterales bacterium]
MQVPESLTIRACSLDIPRRAKLVARQRKVLSKFEFDVEHGLNWIGWGQQLFDSAAITVAFTDTPQLKLGDLYTGLG